MNSERTDSNPVVEQIRSRLLEARTVAYTTSLIVIVIALLTVFSILGRHAEQDRMETQKDELIGISDKAKQTIDEIRRYFRLSGAQANSDGEKIQRLFRDFEQVNHLDSTINKHLLEARAVESEPIKRVNLHLQLFRKLEGWHAFRVNSLFPVFRHDLGPPRILHHVRPVRGHSSRKSGPDCHQSCT